jgi:hypothetical protein
MQIVQRRIRRTGQWKSLIQGEVALNEREFRPWWERWILFFFFFVALEGPRR